MRREQVRHVVHEPIRAHLDQSLGPSVHLFPREVDDLDLRGALEEDLVAFQDDLVPAAVESVRRLFFVEAVRLLDEDAAQKFGPEGHDPRDRRHRDVEPVGQVVVHQAQAQSAQYQHQLLLASDVLLPEVLHVLRVLLQASFVVLRTDQVEEALEALLAREAGVEFQGLLVVRNQSKRKLHPAGHIFDVRFDQVVIDQFQTLDLENNILLINSGSDLDCEVDCG